MPFDKTYVEIITNAELLETREVSEINKKIAYIFLLEDKLIDEVMRKKLKIKIKKMLFQ